MTSETGFNLVPSQNTQPASCIQCANMPGANPGHRCVTYKFFGLVPTTSSDRYQSVPCRKMGRLNVYFTSTEHASSPQSARSVSMLVPDGDGDAFMLRLCAE